MSEKILLRPSEINCYMSCSAKYMFQYIDKIKTGKSLALAFGSSMHRAIESNYSQKIESKEDLDTSEVVQTFVDSFDEETKEVNRVELIEDPTSKDVGVGLVKEYQKKIAPDLQPKAVEQQVQATFKDYTFGITGTMDLLTVDKRLIDHKTASRKNSTPPESHVRQGSYYRLMAVAAGEDVKEVTFTYLVKTKTPQVYNEKILTDPKHALGIAQQVGDAITKGVFIPQRDSFLCTARFCQYSNECIKKFGGRVKP